MSRHPIRSAVEADAGAISDLLGQLGYPSSRDQVIGRLSAHSDDSSVVLVAVSGEAVIGFVSFHRIPLIHEAGSLGRITAMCIASGYRRSGAGRALLAELENRARASGCDRIEVTSGERRAEDAHRFYQSCGYVSDSRRFQKRL